MTLPQKNGSRIKTPSLKSLILVSFCWKKNVVLINALTNLIESLIFLKVVIVGAAFFLCHSVQSPLNRRNISNQFNWLTLNIELNLNCTLWALSRCDLM